MTEHGFQLEGFLRSLQPQIGSFFLAMFVLLVAHLFIRWALRIMSIEGVDEKWTARRILNVVTMMIIIIATLALFGGAFGRMGANRLPRSDVDKSEVYQQMESHNSGPTQ